MTQTWHYGLIANWWAEFNEGGDDVAYFQRVIEECGQPALDLDLDLDLGCGAGRLLLPFLRAGLDVDGCDVAPDMLGHAAWAWTAPAISKACAGSTPSSNLAVPSTS